MPGDGVQAWCLLNSLFIIIKRTRIYGAFSPNMFALRVWVGFGASWRGEPLFLNSSFMFGRTHSSYLEGHIAAYSEGRNQVYIASFSAQATHELVLTSSAMKTTGFKSLLS